LLVAGSPVAAANAQTDGQNLRIRQVKITGDETVVLQNAGSSAVNLGEYWLGYASSDTVTVVVPSQQLPDVSLPAGGVVLLNNGSAETCDASLVASLDFSSLSDSKGTLVLRHLVNTDATSSFTTVDSVTWGKLAADQIQIANESQLPADANAMWYKDPADPASLWQVGDFSNCQLTVINIVNAPPTDPTVTWQSAAGSPPSIVVRTVTITPGGTTAARIPAADMGLLAPQLSEILPNPASPQLDAEDEFIEIYNPNSEAFDLSGFQLQTASTTSTATHTYTFPDGTLVKPFGFKAFRSETTHLSLSNGGGQVWLVDPLGHTVTQSDPYGTAKDGQSWVLSGGHWQWTLQATPDATNKLATAAPTNAGSKTATVNGRSVTAVKGAQTTSAAASAPATNQVSQVTPVHPLTLVVVIALALLYWAYEYRDDLANRIYLYRRYRAARRTLGR
jgi:hypothetical protein